MTTPPQFPYQAVRTNDLALAFQEVFTVILRTRFQTQAVPGAAEFREQMKRMISAAVRDASKLGYSKEAAEMALYAVVAFLDESVLNSKDPVFVDWSKQPLQNEMWNNLEAGDYFYRNVAGLLDRPESPETADLLELHGLCLLLGFRGRLAFGGAAEVQNLLRRIRDKIARIRGASMLFRRGDEPAAPSVSRRDPWVRRLALTALVLAAFTLLAYLGYMVLLGQGLSAASQARSAAPASLSLLSDLPEAFL
ncbi:MAG: DotU family type IV/VI secretion system protein [Terracidiphilus sp.]